MPGNLCQYGVATLLHLIAPETEYAEPGFGEHYRAPRVVSGLPAAVDLDHQSGFYADEIDGTAGDRTTAAKPVSAQTCAQAVRQ